MNRIISTIAFIALIALFTGCASTKVIDKNVPEAERATLYLVGDEYTLHKVDDKKVGSFGIFAGPKGNGTGGLLKKQLKPTAQIPPGTRKITITVPAMIGSGEYDATYDFLPGKKYRVAYEEPGVEDGQAVKSLKEAKEALTRVVTITEITGEIPKE